MNLIIPVIGLPSLCLTSMSKSLPYSLRCWYAPGQFFLYFPKKEMCLKYDKNEVHCSFVIFLLRVLSLRSHETKFTKAKLFQEATFFIVSFSYLEQIYRSKMAMEYSACYSHVLNAWNYPAVCSMAISYLYIYFR